MLTRRRRRCAGWMAGSWWGGHLAERLCGRWTRREATGGQGATQPPAKVPLQRRKEKDQSRQMSCLLSTEFMRNVSPTLIPERQRWKKHKKLAHTKNSHQNWHRNSAFQCLVIYFKNSVILKCFFSPCLLDPFTKTFFGISKKNGQFYVTFW